MAARSDPGAWVTLARLVKTQGHKGELGADLLTDIPGRIDHLRQVSLLHPSGRRQAFGVVRHWFHKGRVVLAFDGIPDMTAAEAWLGAEVQVPRAERAPAPADRYYSDDLEGCEVLDHGRPLGRIEAVEEIPGAPALLHVRSPEGAELLIPFAAAYLESLSLAERRIAMALPEGLLDL